MCSCDYGTVCCCMMKFQYPANEKFPSFAIRSLSLCYRYPWSAIGMREQNKFCFISIVKQLSKSLKDFEKNLRGYKA